ncbi:uncharacterized protein C5L36_0B00630 [Pichia kudriavzevii]|uniref:N-acetyltransferase domain-containing protein n=1 Tax=Pichia kudriavzevii TaxID=4909 RepID=A0A099NVR8_PICKU|nr:uncharacterized protein C5L36_0B00630 [Pichia kudriavzevii]AWU74796.1 hypothetical protein C5L36_0B00630 [Pichia kudriavzevii]KGK36037.1 hypothetical protein JL09_g4813 [Pichia kudriavzevii]
MIEIRDVTETDYMEWLRLFDLYLQFYNSSLPEEVKKSTFYRSLDYNVPMWSAIAISSETGRPIGLVNYLRHVSTWSTQDKIYMNDLYVDESQRLQGVGKALIDYVYAKADSMETPEVYWCTSTSNHRAQLLYCKVGVFADKVIYKRLPSS